MTKNRGRFKSHRARPPHTDTRKCVRAKGYPYVERVSTAEAHRLVSSGEAVYVPKSEWKKDRDAHR